MKDVIPCHSCQLCAIGYETGFAGNELLHCAKLNAYVTREDGCTMGDSGEPGYLCQGQNATLSGHEAVWGYRD